MFQHQLQDTLNSSINITREIFNWFLDKEIYQTVPESIVELSWSIVQPIEVVKDLSDERIFLILVVKFFLFIILFKVMIVLDQHKMEVADLILQFFTNQWELKLLYAQTMILFLMFIFDNILDLLQHSLASLLSLFFFNFILIGKFIVLFLLYQLVISTYPNSKILRTSLLFVFYVFGQVLCFMGI